MTWAEVLANGEVETPSLQTVPAVLHLLWRLAQSDHDTSLSHKTTIDSRCLYLEAIVVGGTMTHGRVSLTSSPSCAPITSGWLLSTTSRASILPWKSGISTSDGGIGGKATISSYRLSPRSAPPSGRSSRSTEVTHTSAPYASHSQPHDVVRLGQVGRDTYWQEWLIKSVSVCTPCHLS